MSIRGEQSDECPVDSGVPQGTVLGPIMFSIFIDDLEEEVVRRLLEVIIIKFADDTKGEKVKRPRRQSFNVFKCKIMHVGRNNPCYENFMNGTKVSTTDEERDVGVMVNKNRPCSVARQQGERLQCSRKLREISIIAV